MQQPKELTQNELRIQNILNSNNSQLIAEFNKDRENPEHSDYNYVYARAESKNGYGPICDQLDMIYWDKINNTETWKVHIENVKKRFPVK